MERKSGPRPRTFAVATAAAVGLIALSALQNPDKQDHNLVINHQETVPANFTGVAAFGMDFSIHTEVCDGRVGVPEFVPLVPKFAICAFGNTGVTIETQGGTQFVMEGSMSIKPPDPITGEVEVHVGDIGPAMPILNAGNMNIRYDTGWYASNESAEEGTEQALALGEATVMAAACQPRMLKTARTAVEMAAHEAVFGTQDGESASRTNGAAAVYGWTNARSVKVIHDPDLNDPGEGVEALTMPEFFEYIEQKAAATKDTGRTPINENTLGLNLAAGAEGTADLSASPQVRKPILRTGDYINIIEEITREDTFTVTDRATGIISDFKAIKESGINCNVMDGTEAATPQEAVEETARDAKRNILTVIGNARAKIIPR